MCKEFFRTRGQRSVGEQICSLKVDDGKINTGLEKVMEMAIDYYRTLFQQELLDPRAHHRCREEVWSHTPTLVQPSMGEALLAPFMVTEMQEVVRDIDG